MAKGTKGPSDNGLAHMSDKAKEAISKTPSPINDVVNPKPDVVDPEPLNPKFSPEGMYLAADHPDAFLGQGWYHYDTPDDQIWIGHDGEADFYIFNFVANETGRVNSSGNDTIDFFESVTWGYLDAVAAVDDFGTIVYGNWYPSVKEDGSLTTRAEWYQIGQESLGPVGALLVHEYAYVG